MVNLKEKAQALRKELKALGYGSRQVSVSARYTGYDGILHVVVKDMAISLGAIENLANNYERYDRDVITGEILAGGNTFVRVSLDWQSVQAAMDARKDQAAELYAKGQEVKPGDGVTVENMGTYCVVYYPHHYNCSMPHIDLLKKPNGYQNMTCYCLDRVYSHVAHNEYHIAEALVYIENQLTAI